MNTNQIGCKDFIMQNKNHFGVTETNLKNQWLDVCVKQVRCIASRSINEEIVLPSMSNFINSCTGLVDSAGGIDTRFASLRVTHAHEELVDCDTDCPGVKVCIHGQIIVRTRPQGCGCSPSYMAIPVELCSEVIRDFYSTDTGDRVQCLKNELPYVDGSCMVINLNCRVYREICNGSSRYVAQITGSVADKLWKLENVWIEGIKAYTHPAVTVCDEFKKDICSACSNPFGEFEPPCADTPAPLPAQPDCSCSCTPPNDCNNSCNNTCNNVGNSNGNAGCGCNTNNANNNCGNTPGYCN